jgi:hypothetical protein
MNQTNSKMAGLRLFPRVLPVALLLAGILALATGVRGIHRSLGSLYWPTAVDQQLCVFR